MIDKLSVNKRIWLVLVLCSFLASITGIMNPRIYDGIIRQDVLPGTIAQDIFSLIASLVILFCIIRIKENDVFKETTLLGMVAYLFYAYGIYVIERVYNQFYLLYMAIFALSFFSLLYSVGHFRKEIICNYQYKDGMRRLSVGFLLFIPMMFNILWLSKLIPLLQARQKIDYYYSIYILDLCFIMPAFVIIAFKTAKKEAFGMLLAPAMFIFGFTLLLPVGLGELLKPQYHLPIDVGGMALYLSLSTFFIVLAMLEIRHLIANRKNKSA